MIKNDKFQKIIYFLVPNLLYVTLFCYFYNITYNRAGDSFEILFREVGILSLVYFVLFGIIYLLIRIKLDYKKTFVVMTSLTLLSFEFVYTSILMWLVILFVNVFSFKMSEENREKMSFFILYVTILMFVFNFVPSVYYCFKTLFRIQEKDVNVTFSVDDNKDVPNIYWIHCDGMINLNDVEKYFNFDSDYLKEYLNDNNYYLNEDASFYSSGHTIQALVSLFNPEYYDKVFKKYLESIPDDNYNDSIISYDVMTEKRINNELFNSLKLKDYKMVTISDFNQYSSFYTDYMFDYYSFQKSDEKDLDYFVSSDNTYEDIKKYNDYSHLKTLADTTFLHFFTDNYSFLKHKEIDYNNFNYEKYIYVDKTEYWKAKAILKSLSIVYDKTKDDSFFAFIDFGINHTPWLYNTEGKIVNTNKEGFLLKNFKDNYEYSTYLLVDILEYIKSNDKDAVIVLQSDHGIHTVSVSAIAKYTNNSILELSDIVSSTFSAVYIPKKYITGEEKYLDNPLNISRYLVNNFVGNNYEYIE